MTDLIRAAAVHAARIRAFADPVLAVMVALSALSVPWFLNGPGDRITSWTAQVALDALMVWFAARLYSLDRDQPHKRRFWLSIVAGSGLSTVGDAYQTVLTAVSPTDAGGSQVQGALVGVGMFVVLITTLTYPLGGTGRQRLRQWLDAATMLAAVAVFLWYYLLAGQLNEPGDRVSAAAVSAVLLLVTFGLLKLIFSHTAPFTRAAGTVAIIGVAGTGFGVPLGAALAQRSDPPLLILAQLLPCVLIPMGLRLQALQMRARRGRPPVVTRRGFSRLPYAAVAATQILLVVALANASPDLRVWGVSAGVVVITALVLGRQLVAFGDNERLVTELDGSMRQLSEQKEWFSALVQHAFDITLVTGAGGAVRYASPAVARVLGVPATRLASGSLEAWVYPDDRATLRGLADRLAAAPGTEAGVELRLRHADGSYRWLHLIGTDLSGNPNVRGVVWNARDVTEARALRERLLHRATHDPLTGLANRALLEQQVHTADPDTGLGVLLLDLDGFKQVNDVHGHQAGDQVLVTVAQRLTALLGTTGTVARLGGDEFAVVLPGSGAAEAEALGARIAAEVDVPIRIGDPRTGGTLVHVGASVGVAVGSPADASHLLHIADLAMYRTKSDRKASVDALSAGAAAGR